jgi:hypothetical protein
MLHHTTKYECFMSKQNGIRVIEFTNWYCDRKICPCHPKLVTRAFMPDVNHFISHFMPDGPSVNLE